MFRRLAVFPASFDLEAAEAIAGPVGTDVDVVDCVVRLVDRSLVAHSPSTGRYQLLETLRQYGTDRLVDGGELDEARDRHAGFYTALAERYGQRRSRYRSVGPGSGCRTGQPPRRGELLPRGGPLE